MYRNAVASTSSSYPRALVLSTCIRNARTHRRHVHDELPERLLARLCKHVPYRIIDRRQREVNHALFWADPSIRQTFQPTPRVGGLPAQLRIAGHPIPCPAHVRKEFLGIVADQALREELDSVADLWHAPSQRRARTEHSDARSQCLCRW